MKWRVTGWYNLNELTNYSMIKFEWIRRSYTIKFEWNDECMNDKVWIEWGVSGR
jgi:hypothetical protein